MNYQAYPLLVNSKHFTLNIVELPPRKRDPETLSPPSNANASNQIRLANVLPPSQKFTYMVITGCKSRAGVPKMHSGNSSQNCTYMVRSGCESRASVPKLHPNLIEASEVDEIVVSWQGGGRLLNNLETREANKQDRRPKKR